MSDTLLSRVSSSSLQAPFLTDHQNQVDNLVSGFADQVTDWRSMAAMTAGGMAYRFGRIGTMSVGVARPLSLAAGLGAEVTAFEMTHRSLTSLGHEGPINPNLWRWEGQGGLGQGLSHSLITFGALRGAGALAQGENIVVQHLLQDTAMVTGHQLSAAFGITDRPTGSLANQFLEAEATNLQMTGSLSLVHGLAPAITGLERGLDLMVRSRETGIRFPLLPGVEGGDSRLAPAFAAATGRGIEGGASERPLFSNHIMMMKGEPEEAPASSERPREAPGEGRESIPPRSPAEILRELGRLLSEVGENLDESKLGAERTRDRLKELGRLAEEHPQVLNEIASLVDTIRRYPSIGESLEPVLRTLNQEGRTTKGALGAAQRELQKIIHDNPELRRQAENFLRWRHLIPNGLTLFGAYLGLLSSIHSLEGEPERAVKFLIAAAIIDKIDGIVARVLRAKHEIGARLDSYADFANYGLASAMFAYSTLNQHGERGMAWGVASIIALMATLRLATFDYLDSNPHALPVRDVFRNPILGHGKDFIGMPSTMMGLILPALYWAFGENHPDIFYGLSAFSGIAMYAPLRYGKLTDGILGGIGRRIIQTIRNPVKLAVSGATAGILAFLGYRFPEFSVPLLQVGVLGGLGTYVASPGIEAFSRLFTSNNNNNHVSPTPPPVLAPPKIDEGEFSTAPPPPEHELEPAATSITEERGPKSRR